MTLRKVAMFIVPILRGFGTVWLVGMIPWGLIAATAWIGEAFPANPLVVAVLVFLVCEVPLAVPMAIARILERRYWLAE